MPTAPKNCLVTGGAGFIGSHIIDRLLADGHNVIAIDNFASGNPNNIKHLANEPRFRFLQADIADYNAIAEAFKGIDWVFHMAALADIVPSIQKPAAYHHSNVDGTFAALEAARHAGVKRFIYAASSTCYGLAETFPTPETAPCTPMFPYALTKYLAEEMVMHWAQLYGMPCVSLRMFNVYGPRARTSGSYGAVFGVFLAQKINKQPFTVVGDGKQTRDFTYVTDIADAFVTAAASSVSGEIFNIGSGGTYSINRLVELLGGEITYVPKRPGEPDCTFADTSKVQKLLGWKPRVSFEDGVANMLACINDWANAPVWTPETVREATADWFKYLGKDSSKDKAA